MKEDHRAHTPAYMHWHNAQMWTRLGLPRVAVETPMSKLAEYNLERRLLQAARIYVEEAGIGD